MNRIAKFEKVSYEQFKKDLIKNYRELDEDIIKEIYNDIKLPARATVGSAGYDFCCPYSVSLTKHFPITIPTGIRVKIENGWKLDLLPRSSMGFKHGIRLANTVGLIDSDYYYSDNEGHIMAKLRTDEIEKINLTQGTAFIQGVFTPFGITTDDNVNSIRNGGIGSTDTK